MNNLLNNKKKLIPIVLNTIIGNNFLRKIAVEKAKKHIYKSIVEDETYYTKNIRYERYTILANLVNTLDRALTNSIISKSVRKKLLNVFIQRVFLDDDENIGDVFEKEFGFGSPGFITISPGIKCNLNCIGCYASSNSKASAKLDFNTVSKIIQEKTDTWGSFFTVISGGEPLMWRSEGKDLIDLCKKHSDNYFMAYTNGTLITKEMARRMADVGNITPTISVEGFEKETDERRGKGVFKKILQAMENLREVGVPFGISVTATKNNAEVLMSDEFADFFFKEQGAIYGWIFQYMPIGRHQTLDLVVTPEQRKWMYERGEHLIHDKHYFYPDFWNGGVYSSGCLAAARPGGYMYIDWNGDIAPCVFFPYSKDNINDIYAKGGSINDALNSDLFKGIRQWQSDYAFRRTGEDVQNMIAPCSIRDHYDNAHKVITETNAKPIDGPAAEALKDPLYYEGMVNYNKKFSDLTNDIWKKVYIEVEDGNFVHRKIIDKETEHIAKKPTNGNGSTKDKNTRISDVKDEEKEKLLHEIESN